MKNHFICPKCKGFLDVGEQIVLAASTKNHQAGLIFLSPELGNYSVTTNPQFRINLGEKYDFYCPICHEKLATDIHDNLSRVMLVDENSNHFEVLFSKIAGEKSTYKIIGKSAELYGDHKENYLNFINLSELRWSKWGP